MSSSSCKIMIQAVAAGAAQESSLPLPVKEIPGSYGIPFLSSIRDRLDFYYFQGQDDFFKTRIEKYSSTVFRVNMPPGPFMAHDPRVIAVLDAKSFDVLFDVSKVEKRNVLCGTYMPSTSFTGGYRVCAYLDPSEPTHAKIKQLLVTLLASRKFYVIPSFRSIYSSLFQTMESQLAASLGAKSDFNKLNDETAFDFLGDAFFGVSPSSTNLGTNGPSKATKWLFFQLCPLMTLGLPKILEELFLHTFPLPPFLAKSDYKALYAYFSSSTAPVLDTAEKLGLSREEACHNLLFATIFNSYGGFKVLFPGILKWLALADPNLHSQLAKEIRSVVQAEGGKVTLAAIEKMELTKSVVYEALRMDPPVKFQYGKAKHDLVIESHDAAYKVSKGEMIFGYQPFATKDTRVFENGDKFVGDRFVGEQGKKLLKHVLWSNGHETESPTVENKQCAGKDFVVLIGRLLLVEFFLRYDTFTAEVGTLLLGAQVTITSLTKATSFI
ncbi:allene oxide synthase 2-like [Dioscorea cayenensis subsp. rotundata]|uniref:Allene oxide synthase 2-like n=1 Tax=Dioscorea cayennensis subsp. rotundata TaxID=55577 RepID=A0AB40AYM0_DIOCR|nr:allene oxide synthase 2-like [Dioscorea cayenensis subsp. rotundata]